MASEIAIEAISPARTGSSRPRRSDQRPSSGLCAAPVAALTTQKTVMPSAPTPTASRLSGPSTVRQPNSSEASAISQTPETTLALRSDVMRSLSGWRICRRGAGMRAAQIASPTPRAATLVNAIGRPVTCAAPPTSGPSSAPVTAAPSAMPSSSPRRLGGASAASHASPPVHAIAAPVPWAKRRVSSSQT